MTEYPRDVVGYAGDPPHARWPRDARLALQFVINYEEGGESCVLHGDASSETFLSEIIDAQPYTGARHMSMESIYEYGSRAGFWRLHRLFTERGWPVTVFGVATALQRNPAAVRAMRSAGAAHGGVRREAPGLVHGPRQPQHAPAGRRGRRLSVPRRLLRGRSTVLVS
jgi:peptidoglycan/xylan/chitin deacetylase (PgdA/CDA1 family)